MTKTFWNALSRVARHGFTTVPQKRNVQAWIRSIRAPREPGNSRSYRLLGTPMTAMVLGPESRVYFLDRGAAINADVYGATLEGLRGATRRPRPRLLTKGCVAPP